jgi:hypothetical protein
LINRFPKRFEEFFHLQKVFAVAKKKKPCWPEVLIKKMHYLFSNQRLKINQDVSTEDDFKRPLADGRRPVQVEKFKSNLFLKRGSNLDQTGLFLNPL